MYRWNNIFEGVSRVTHFNVNSSNAGKSFKIYNSTCILNLGDFQHENLWFRFPSQLILFIFDHFFSNWPFQGFEA